jgi:hypothetical protein
MYDLCGKSIDGKKSLSRERDDGHVLVVKINKAALVILILWVGMEKPQQGSCMMEKTGIPQITGKKSMQLFLQVKQDVVCSLLRRVGQHALSRLMEVVLKQIPDSLPVVVAFWYQGVAWGDHGDRCLPERQAKESQIEDHLLDVIGMGEFIPKGSALIVEYGGVSRAEDAKRKSIRREPNG